MLLISLPITIQTNFFGIHKVFSKYLTKHRDRFGVYDSIHSIDYDQLLSITHSLTPAFIHTFSVFLYLGTQAGTRHSSRSQETTAFCRKWHHHISFRSAHYMWTKCGGDLEMRSLGSEFSYQLIAVFKTEQLPTSKMS